MRSTGGSIRKNTPIKCVVAQVQVEAVGFLPKTEQGH